MNKIKILLCVILLFVLSADKIHAQFATNVTQYDCDGQLHDLFADLDSGKVVVIEFVMDCQLCADAGIAIETLLNQLHQQYPGVIKVYQFAYSTLVDCAGMTTFKDTNNFQSFVFEENGHLMAHYGGFGMPTIGVAAGANHMDIFSQVGFSANDTVQLGNVLRNYLSSISVNETSKKRVIIAYPNPADDIINIESHSQKGVKVEIYNMYGIPVASLLLGEGYEKTKKIDISFLLAGNYLIRWINEENSGTFKTLINH